MTRLRRRVHPEKVDPARIVTVGALTYLPLSRSLLVSMGWESAVYIPKKVGESPFAMWGSTSENLWHIGQAFVKLHVRVPYTVNL